MTRLTAIISRVNSSSRAPLLLRSTHLVGLLIFVLAFLIFKSSPLHPINDSKYSMMLSQCLIEHHSFALDHYAVPRLSPTVRSDYVQNGDIYQIEQVGPHLYYFFPPGSSVLSIPFVLLANGFGISAVKPDGSFDLTGEAKIESLLAAFLMALLAVVLFQTARLLLPTSYSLFVTLGGALGTQIWSTTSRAMFTDTWAVLLLSTTIFCLLAHEAQGKKLRPVLVATMLAWTYLVYPSYAVHIVVITIYLLFVFSRRQLLAYSLTGLAWAALLFFYSWHNFKEPLPNYFKPGRLLFQRFWTALPGNLISPSRGFLIFVPTTILVAYLLVRFRRNVSHRRLVILALSAMGAQLIVISGFDHWWGGHSYGPRFVTSLVPWLVFLGTIGLRAMIDHYNQTATVWNLERWLTVSVGVCLLIVSIFIHYRGASSEPTSVWNTLPQNVDAHPERVWDWRQPQFLAGLLQPPFPREPPLLEKQQRIDFGTRDCEPYLWYGWSFNEGESRWTDGAHATIIFSIAQIQPLNLRMRAAPFLAPGRLDEQRVTVKLNQKVMTTLVMRGNELTDYPLSLPADRLRSSNILEFQIFGATTPASLGLSDDKRQLGFRVTSLAVE